MMFSASMAVSVEANQPGGFVIPNARSTPLMGPWLGWNSSIQTKPTATPLVI
ncbi:hypothetical protein D3C76_1793420 [compost metagenome]